MNRSSGIARNLPVLLLLLATAVHAAPITVDLAVEASRPAPNDLMRATVAAEANGATPAALSKQVNGMIDEALKTAKTYPAVKTQSSGTSTYPVYAKGGKIESWHMRSELSLESADAAALSELLGRLQASLGVSSLIALPSPETRKKAENEAMLEAIAAFKARAQAVADTLGHPYRITQISINTSGRIPQPVFRAMAKSMAAEAAPMPMEAGESQVSASVSGQIELE